jgi:NADH:ubiquinone oxidoreductase subunit 2 (subunit N)
MSDDLLQPTVQSAAREPRKLPWRVQSQMWVAFFGGIAAVTVIALLNARRLEIDRRRQWMMAGAGIVALGVLFAFWMRQPAATAFFDFTRRARDMRIIGRVIAMVLFFVLSLLQKPADAHYRIFSKGEYAPLWTAGFAATLVLGTAQTLLLAGIAWWVLS